MRWLKGNELGEYAYTADDALVLARAVAREGAPHRAVAWTLVQRFAWLYPTYPTLAALVQAYSQPINPRWFPGGDLHMRAMQTLDAAGQADEARRAALREQYAAAPWEAIPPEARQAALEALETITESPVPGAVHFRASMAPRGATRRQAYDRGLAFAADRADLEDLVKLPEGYGQGVNWFFRAPGSSALRIVPEGDDPLVAVSRPAPPAEEPPDPKARPTQPPPGLPTGAGWGWVYCWAPSFSSDMPIAAEPAAEPAPFASVPMQSVDADPLLPEPEPPKNGAAKKRARKPPSEASA